MKTMRKMLLLAMFLSVLGLYAQAGGEQFARVMVVDNGRVMPLDSYARIVLRSFSGRESVSGKGAVTFMADLLFSPESTQDDALFLIDHPDIYGALGISGDKRARISFRTLEPTLDRLSELARSASWLEPGKRSAVETGLLQLYEHVYLYVSLRDALAFLTTKADTEVNEQSNKFLPVLPADQVDGAWSSLQAARSDNHPFHAGIGLWRQAMEAYQQGRFMVFDASMAEFNRLIAGHVLAGKAGFKIGCEVFYNRLDPFFMARIVYGTSLVLLLLSFIFWPIILRRISLFAVLLGFTVHSSGLVLRFLITHRSPVTNLYETFIFVSWAAVLLGMSLGMRKHRPLSLLISGASGLAFLMIAVRFGGADTMGQLVAVLNNNWWLSVHVITISAGYAGCVVAGIIGHVYIVQSLLRNPNQESLDFAQRSLYATLIFGLFFTFVGTVMGGIWADQSWGRFWGWDPKENGALVIILWVALLLHARLARMIGPFGMAAGAVGSIIMVVLAWFGVNLLGVGMHSYGFTGGIAKGLILFVLAECLFLIVMAFKNQRQRLSI